MSAPVPATPETPADLLRRAAAKVRKLGKAATPGPWERAMKTRTKSAIVAPTPDDVEFWQADRPQVDICAVPTMGPSGFVRKRSGRDLDWIAALGPQVAEPLAAWLEREAIAADRNVEAWHHKRPDGWDGDIGDPWIERPPTEHAALVRNAYGHPLDLAAVLLGGEAL